MGVRLKGEYYSTDGELWTWQLIDTDFGDLQHDTLLTSEGLVFSPSGDENNKDTRFISCKCTFTLIVDHNYIEDFITDIIDAPEGRFFLRAGRDGGVTYIGKIAVDGGEYEDNAWPIEFRLISVDGIGGLQGTNYSETVGYEAPYTGPITLLEHVFNCLDKTSLIDHYTGQDYLWVVCNWYEDQHPNNTDNPLDMTRVDGSAFYTIGADTNQFDYLSCQAVLKNILINFGATLEYVGPHYLIQQRSERASASFRVFKYGTGRGLISSGSISDEITISNAGAVVYRKGGSSFGFLPGMRMAKIIYNHGDQDVNYLNGLTYSGLNTAPDPPPALAEVGTIDVQTGEDTVLRFSCKVKTNSLIYPIPLTAPRWKNHRYVFRIELKLVSLANTYYLWKPYEGHDFYAPEWGFVTFQGVEQFYDYRTNIIDISMGDTNLFHDIGFDTPKIIPPGLYTISFKIEFIGVIGEKGEILTSLDNPWQCYWELLDLELYGIVAGNILKRPTQSISQVNGNPDNSYSLTEETVIGDGPGKSSKGRLQVYNGTEWKDSLLWKAAGVGTSRKLHLVAAQELIASQQTSLLVVQGGFYDRGNTTTAMSRIHYAGLYFLLMSARYNTAADLWEGSWARIVTPARTGLEWVDKTILKQEKVQTPLNPHKSPDNEDKEDRILGILIDDGILHDVEITSIPLIEAAITNLWNAGDIINMVDPSKGNVQRVVVAVDVHEGDTSVSIEAVTPEYDYPPGSYLRIDEQYQITNVYSETGMAYQYEDDFSGTELVCTHDLTDLTLESDQSTLSLRHLVYKNGTKLILNHPLGWHIDNTGNKVVFEEPCYNDSIEIYSHKVKKVY